MDSFPWPCTPDGFGRTLESKSENLNPNNEIDLLRRFGRKSITNPFELAVSA